jgi:hypothetical protein
MQQGDMPESWGKALIIIYCIIIAYAVINAQYEKYYVDCLYTCREYTEFEDEYGNYRQ